VILIAGCVVGEGPATSETREVRAFDRIEVGSGIHVAIRIGPAEDLELRAQENVLGAIATDVEGSTLIIDAREDFTSVDPVTVTIVVPVLHGISMSGGAQARIDDLEAASIAIDIRGGASATLVGTADAVELTADGGAVAHLQDLITRSLVLNLSGGAAAMVNATVAVTGSASGGSSLTVVGDADVQVETSGGSQVVRE
jgi:hypothetical protein